MTTKELLRKQTKMSSSSSSSDGYRSVVVRKNPTPHGTTFTMVLPWVHDSTKVSFVANIFKRLEWANILDIHMIYKKAMPPREKGGRPKPAHYKVFIHLGARNPAHASVFQYLGENKELKVYYNETYFWKVRMSTWKPDSRNDIRVDFVSSANDGGDCATTAPATSGPGDISDGGPGSNPTFEVIE